MQARAYTSTTYGEDEKVKNLIEIKTHVYACYEIEPDKISKVQIYFAALSDDDEFIFLDVGINGHAFNPRTMINFKGYLFSHSERAEILTKASFDHEMEAFVNAPK